MKGLITSEKLYYRLMTDPAFNKNDFWIVYFDAIKNAFVDMPIIKWVPKDGDIPWHRVYFLKYHDQVIWDREKRFFSLDCVPKAEVQMLGDDVCVLTLNSLFDIYDSDVTNIVPRMPNLMKLIDSCGADIVCLQEITPKFDSLLHGLPLAEKDYRSKKSGGCSCEAWVLRRRCPTVWDSGTARSAQHRTAC